MNKEEFTTPAKFIEDKIHEAFLELAELVADGTFELDHPAPLIFASMHLTNCWHQYISDDAKVLESKNDIPYWASRKIEKLIAALRDEYIMSSNDHYCKGCGTSWALGSPHEDHDEHCPLHKDNWAIED